MKNHYVTDHSDYGSAEHCLDEINEDQAIWLNVLQVLKSVVIQLPNANRDSLAFLMLHFHRILDAESTTKICLDNLVKIFASSIVGTSQVRFRGSLSRKGALAVDTVQSKEAAKQQAVLRSLFRLSVVFWDGLLKDPNFCPFVEVPTNELKKTRLSLNQSVIKQISSSKLLEGKPSCNAGPDSLY